MPQRTFEDNKTIVTMDTEFTCYGQTAQQQRNRSLALFLPLQITPSNLLLNYLNPFRKQILGYRRTKVLKFDNSEFPIM